MRRVLWVVLARGLGSHWLLSLQAYGRVTPHLAHPWEFSPEVRGATDFYLFKPMGGSPRTLVNPDSSRCGHPLSHAEVTRCCRTVSPPDLLWLLPQEREDVWTHPPLSDLSVGNLSKLRWETDPFCSVSSWTRLGLYVWLLTGLYT